MKAIGGYFELELVGGIEFHPTALRLNTGRNALEYIIKSNKYKKIYIPYYTCDVIVDVVKKLGIEYVFYNIDEKFEPDFNYNLVGAGEAFLYTNYNGIKDSYVKYLSEFVPNLIIDNAQAFFSTPIPTIDTFYSARKFFGVPDGAYLYANNKLQDEFPKDYSFQRFDHLLRRLDVNAEDGFRFFQENENRLNGQSIMQMSKSTKTLLSSINYTRCASIRRSNFDFLHKFLSNINKLKIPIIDHQVPMTYPLLTDNDSLRNHLIANKIYTPVFWPNVLDWVSVDSIEYHYSSRIVNLPIDQRYNLKDMEYIIKKIKSLS